NSFRAHGRRRKIRNQLLASFPRREQRFQATDDVFVANVADHDEDRVVRHQLAAMKLDEVVTRNAIDRLRRRRYNRIRMIAKHHTRNHLAREKRWLRALLSQTLLRVLLRERDFILRKRRLEHYFRHQVEYRIVELR